MQRSKIMKRVNKADQEQKLSASNRGEKLEKLEINIEGALVKEILIRGWGRKGDSECKKGSAWTRESLLDNKILVNR